MFSTLKFADSKVEGIFTSYYQELLATITQLEAVIVEGKKANVDDFRIESLMSTVKYANEAIENRFTHMQDMTKYNKGIVSRDVTLTAAGTLAGVTDHCVKAITKYREQLAEKMAWDAEQAERASRRAKEQEEQEEQDRNRYNNNNNNYTAPKYPTGVTDEAMSLILQYGYRKAAAMNHPDCGGTHEGMVAVNATNDYMKKMGMV